MRDECFDKLSMTARKKNVAKAICCFDFTPRAKARGNGLVASPTSNLSPKGRGTVAQKFSQEKCIYQLPFALANG